MTSAATVPWYEYQVYNGYNIQHTHGMYQVLGVHVLWLYVKYRMQSPTHMHPLEGTGTEYSTCTTSSMLHTELMLVLVVLYQVHTWNVHRSTSTGTRYSDYYSLAVQYSMRRSLLVLKPQTVCSRYDVEYDTVPSALLPISNGTHRTCTLDLIIGGEILSTKLCRRHCRVPDTHIVRDTFFL